MSDRDEVLTREQAKLKKLAKLLDEGGGINPAVTMNEAAAVIRAVALRAPTLPTTAAPVSDKEQSFIAFYVQRFEGAMKKLGFDKPDPKVMGELWCDIYKRAKSMTESPK